MSPSKDGSFGRHDLSPECSCVPDARVTCPVYFIQKIADKKLRDA